MENKIQLMNKCNIDIEESSIQEFFLVIFKDILGNFKVYFATEECDNSIYLYNKNDELILLATYDVDNDCYISCYGVIDNVICLRDLIVTYGMISNNYDIDVINAIINDFLNDYIKLKKEDTIKKLELKK